MLTIRHRGRFVIPYDMQGNSPPWLGSRAKADWADARYRPLSCAACGGHGHAMSTASGDVILASVRTGRCVGPAGEGVSSTASLRRLAVERGVAVVGSATPAGCPSRPGTVGPYR